MQKQDKQILSLKEKVLDITSRGMANNVIISGITGDVPGENCEDQESDPFPQTCCKDAALRR